MKIADIPAGPDLDRLVAEKVMGWKWGPTGADYSGWQGSKQYPNGMWNRKNDACRGHWSPSTDIAHAWEVVEHMEQNGGLIANMYSQRGCWSVGIEPLPESRYIEVFREVAETAPLAICRAALLAVGCEVVQ